MERNVDTALKITTTLKSLLDNPAAQILTAIIPGDVDEVIRVKAIQGLNIAIEVLNLESTCKNADSLEAKLECFISEVRKRNPDLQDAIFHKVASIITRSLDDEQKAQNVYDLLVQARFSTNK
ncbi:hypothetical protein F0L74_05940 [Chitinophaga agrisoli]|uniref:Uncharacterized protein n=1 Tax=Chitinophaga agrisoli TaxID=2607653 RepID=A0A5B2W546_9BACT|nr:hypothetical protein [Chitinophaga agrisoli]KAA2245497.1 hypothetical protein F0L74_05940 [Chitinophaga agrisoli]